METKKVETKKWYLSKTIWVNLLALVGAFFNAKCSYEMTAEEIASILVVINIIMRAITKQPLG